jgi:hypothetical protein
LNLQCKIAARIGGKSGEKRPENLDPSQIDSKVMFDKGQKVACINDDFSATVRHLYRQLPQKDGIYTVREVRIGRLNVTSGAGGGNAVSYLVLLEELYNPDDPYMRDGAGEEMGFRSDRFAPLEEIENAAYAEEEEPLVRVR